MQKGIFNAATIGLIGAAIWAGIVYYADYEIGLLAWGIGAAVGYGMLAGVKENPGPASGTIALVIALLSIVGGKYIAIELLYNDIDTEMNWDKELADFNSDETYATTYVADGIVAEYRAEGKALDYPPGADLEVPQSEDDYPADVWKEATTRWQAMSADERQTFGEESIAANKAAWETISTELRTDGFLASFSMFDVLWFVLGGASAYSLGAGLKGND